MITPLLLALALNCGVERQKVKVLTDPDALSVNLNPVPTTIDDLRDEPAPKRWTPALERLPAEMRAVQVTAKLIGFKLEDDEDFHLVIVDAAGQTMIAEIPSERCSEKSIVAKQIAQARASFVRLVGGANLPAVGRFKKLRRPIVVVIEGVVFMDKIHGQTGVAPNGVEIHPVIRIEKGE